ncbi:hypothetical protein [Marinovum sp.]|uniref:hypothetical protein n=1 Tax=Marinovum sp. TaxID=2024839 RepID=UPI002B267C75|nr:hypothetical protein [Marinovum sp.]
MTRLFLALSVLFGLAAFALSLRLYFGPLTGVEGTAGPLLTALGSAAQALLVLFIAIFPYSPSQGPAAAFALLAAILTGVAGWFLLSWPILIAITLAAACLVVALARLPSDRKALA